MEENNNDTTSLVSQEPIFYTKEELSEIQDIIKYYMEHINENKFNEADDDITKGCKITAFIANHAKENNYDEKIVSAYIQYPPFLLYTDTEHKAIRRIYGMGIRENGKVIAYAVTAMSMINNDVVGGLKLDKCVPVKEWSSNQKNFLNSGLVKGSQCFIEPFGFTAFLNN